MSSNSRIFRGNVAAFVAAFILSAAPAWLLLRRNGFDDETFGVILRSGARVALLVFLVAFVARPLHQLVKTPATRRLLANRRLVGVAFAGVMSAHLLFLLWFNGFVVAPGMLVFALIFLMLLTSFRGPAAAIGPKRWKVLHRTGLYVTGFAFSLAVLADLRAGSPDPAYRTLAILVIVAVAIRVAAFWRQRRTA